MTYKKTPDICSGFGISNKDVSDLACLNLHKEEVIENRFIDSVKDFSEKRNFISFRPVHLSILKITRRKISSYRLECSYRDFLDSRRNARVSS
ncbi:MAG: hypothetical protein WDA59_08965 [Methanofastidiosum sp.]